MTKFDQLLSNRVPLPAPKANPETSLSHSIGSSDGRYSSLKSNNCNALSPARQSFTRLPRPSGQGKELAGSVSVARAAQNI
ncbi:hypothetical protein CC2G_015241 [Coprinopsis cinerea AmutBmut pab1-1]|nr:hypothetical protein CC2G_015241 [Coprinopsis cinerea AmutBmut pab1-1]